LRLVTHINLARGYRGGERQTEILIRELAGRAWRQRLVARRGEALAGSLAGLTGLEVREVPNNPLAAARALTGSDMVHVHEARALQAAWLQWLLSSRPYVVTRRVQKQPSANWLNRRMYASAARVVCVSQAIGASLRGMDTKLQTECVPDATSNFANDPARVGSLRSMWGGGFVVGHVGALIDSHKGQCQIIEIARRLQGKNPELRFVLVGGGPDEAMLRARAASLNNVIFAGQVSNVGDYLAAFDVFVYPSRHEGLGSVLLDAMQFGLPIVATAVGGIPEIIEQRVNGMLCQPDDIDGLAAAVVTLRDDIDLRTRMGMLNRARAQLYSPEQMTTQYERIYDEVLGSH
jgi:glycosyltransferase involved in cell wall biosynthesis